jgi:TolC family type I secretion outer membrane protein
MKPLAASLAVCLLLTPPLARADKLDPALSQALAAAYATNPQLAVARAQLRETDESVPRALSGWRPNVTLSSEAGISALYDSLDTVHRPEHRLPNQEEAAISQPLYTGGQVTAQVAQAEALVRAQRAALQASEASVLLAAATAYLDVARDQQLVALNRNQVTVLEHSLKATEQAAAIGVVTQADAEQARARLADQVAQTANAEGALARSAAIYQQQIGEKPGTLAIPTTAPAVPADRETVLSLVESANFDVAEARQAVEAARQGVDIARAGLLPKLSFKAAVAYVGNTDVQQYHERDGILEGDFDLTIPLYEAGKAAAETRQAKEAVARSTLQVDAVLTAARAQAMTAFDMLDAAHRRVAAFTRSIDANIVAERGIARQQGAGARTVLDVLNAQQELLAANVQKIAALRDEYVDTLQLLAFTGALSAAQLELPVPLYDPVAHYDATRDRWYGTDPAQ